MALQAQNKDYTLSIQMVDKDTTFLEKQGILNQFSVTQQVDIKTALEQVYVQLAEQGYIASQLEKIQQDSQQYKAYIKAGEVFKWLDLRKGNVHPSILNAVGFRERFYKNKPFHYSEWVKLMKSLQDYTENNGYPFAEISLDSIDIHKDNTLSASLNVSPNKLIQYKGVEIIGDDVQISKSYLENYLGIKAGTLYQLDQIKAIPKRIKDLPFLESTRNPVVTFRGDKATINLFLKKRKSSRFDFIVGLLPSNNSTNQRRVLLTLDGVFSAQNLLGKGERFLFEFRQPQANTQRLDIELSYPYIFQMPFSTDVEFSLYKRDSTFLDVEYNLGLSYLFNADQYLKAFGHSKSSNLLSVNKAQVINTKVLPNNLDTRFTDFGIEYHWETLDYKYNPKRGFNWTTSLAAGFRSIKKNTEIIGLQDANNPSFKFETLYDSLKLRTFQYKIDSRFQWFVPFYPKGRGVVMVGNQTGGIFSPQTIYNNEQYRIGGNKVLRGFDEESIRASLYSIFTLEYRFLLGQNSYLYTFLDYGYMENKNPLQSIKDRPLGFGAGLAFDTALGVFGVSLAYGKQNDIPIDYRATKIHFGYVSYF